MVSDAYTLYPDPDSDSKFSKNVRSSSGFSVLIIAVHMLSIFEILFLLLEKT